MGRKRYIQRVEELIQTLLDSDYPIMPLKEIVEAHSNVKWSLGAYTRGRYGYYR